MQCAFITRGAVEIFPSKMRNSLARFRAQSEMAGYFELRSICKRLHHLICEFKPYFRFDLHF